MVFDLLSLIFERNDGLFLDFVREYKDGAGG